jgi:NADH:ubiquinone oxidoreductase subunit 3 (subunit A)
MPEKLSEYECGFPAFEDPRRQFDVRFYLVAILFIIFRPRSGLPVSLGSEPRPDRLDRMDHDDDFPG